MFGCLRRVWPGLLCALLFWTGATAQTDEQRDRMARTAEILAQSPILPVGATQIDSASAEGQFFWLMPEAHGLYRIAIDGPGAIRMSTFPNADGQYDGQTAERVVAEAANAYGGPQIGPFLLARGWPYLLSVNATGPATLTLEQLDVFDDPVPLPERGSIVEQGEYLMAFTGDLRLSLADPDAPLMIETWSEPRADHQSDAEGSSINRRLAPYDPDADTRLNLRTNAPDGQPSALTLLRVAPFAEDLDETEPNRNDPDMLDTAQPFRGLLLRGDDRDRLRFTVPAAQDVLLSVETDAIWADFAMTLERLDERQSVPVLRRRSVSGALPGVALRLEAGDYILELAGDNPNDRAIGYTVAFAPASPPVVGQEVEPNDHFSAATPLSQGGVLRGRAGADDIDYVAFSVDAPNRLWRVFTLSADRVILSGRTGVIADVAAIDGRAIADALALAPGDYSVEIRGTGNYAFRVMDLGPRPDRHEAEPNNTPVDAQLLRFGEAFTGAFSGPNDLDLFQFRLGAETPVAITIAPPGDGPMDAQLFLGNARWGNSRDFLPGDDDYVFEGTLPAGDWFIQLRSRSNLTRGTYRIAVARSAARPDGRPDQTPATARPMPMDGKVTGVVGAFDAEDHFLLRLPAAPRAALIGCDAPGWSLWPWSGGRKIGNPRDGMMVVAPDLAYGGAVRIVAVGDARQAAYTCAVRFKPEEDALGEAATAPGSDVIVFASGDHVQGTMTEEAPRQSIAFDVAPGSFGIAACFDGDGVPVPARAWRPRDLALAPDESFAPFVPFRAGPAPGIELRTSSGRASMGWRCALLGMEDMSPLADLGALAALTPPPDAAPAVPQGAPGVAGTPPSLDALLALVPPATEPSGDLPVSIAFDPAPPVAAYAQAGQRITLGAALVNTGNAPLDLALDGAVAGDGWHIAVAPDQLALAPGQMGQATVTLTAPPWLSPVVPPTVTLTATAGTRFATTVLGIAVSPEAPTQGPFVYFDAPAALRGGLNLLHYGLGTRLIDMEGATITARDAEGRFYLHDGIAPHAAVREVGRDLTFQLPAPARVAGAMFQLRSTANPLSFPSSYEIYHSDDGTSWRRAAVGRLNAAMTPQYAVFDTPITASYLRFRFPECPANGCNRVAVQEIQAIGVPGEHPAGWPPINAADLALGGHVIYSSPNHAGGWNATLLAADPNARNSGWRLRSNTMRAVIGFHQNRAALVERLVWVGNPNDTARAAGAEVAVSLTGPAGPWTSIGTLPAPPIGEDRAELLLARPVWARYVRLSFSLPQDTAPAGPDAVQIIEAPGTSVIGLWEDDRPEAAFEAMNGTGPVAAVAPAGGADRDRAVPLSPGATVTSSVLLERNEDWWRLTIPEGPMQEAHFDFQTVPLEVAVELSQVDGAPVPLEKAELDTSTRMTALLAPGDYILRVHEPPRSVVIAWDTSGSVAAYIPKTLAAVRLWSESLVPGRDVLQLLPFDTRPQFVLDDWAAAPQDVAPALRDLVTTGSSAAETTLAYAADALARREGARGVVLITDAETGPDAALWPNLLRSRPRVVALSIDSDGRQNATIMMDWANLNRGRFQRVVGAVGLADGLDMAAALFRAPKSYELMLTSAPYEEPEGEATIRLEMAEPQDGAAPAPSGAVEVILDASGSMLQRLDGKRRIAIAHDALSRLVDETLPEGMPFAFRAFGLEADACRSELRMPLAPLDRAAARRAIRDVPAINNARTAIADSLTAAARDLAEASDPRVIVLVTDGEETCDGDPEAAIRAIRAGGQDVRVNIVGFAIDDAALAATFEHWAEAGGGAYFEARDSQALDAAVDQALTPVFGLARRYIDGRSVPIGALAPGETLTIPAGQIEIVPEGIAAGASMTVRLAPGDNLKLVYDPVTGLSGD